LADPGAELEDRIHRLKAGLVAISRGEQTDLSEAEFRETKRHLVGNPKLRERVPTWLKTASTLHEAKELIKAEADPKIGGKWANRAKAISEGLNPLLSEIEEERAVFEAAGDLGERLGGGGFGEVFRWRHKVLDIDFAVKVLNPSFPSDEGRYLDRFFREARILFKLNHPGIVRVYDVGMFGRRPFIRMELLVGQDLNGVLRGGTLSPHDAARVAFDLSAALSHAHAEGIVHRDIKPSNVYWTSEGRICLIDFGLGAFVEGDLVSRITRTGEAAVGGLYTAPELVAEPRRLEPRSDIYSVGAVWFTTLVGRPPAGTSISEQLRAVSGLSENYRAVVIQALSDESSRFQSADELAAAINDLETRRAV
jgi:serine/threonine-protein kinase